MQWPIQTTDEFDDWYRGLGAEEQDEIDTKVEMLKALGPLLKRPHADTLNGSRYSNMKELRGKTRGALPRIAFAFDPLKTGILLCGDDKKGVSEKGFYKRLIDKADKLYEQHLKDVEKRRAELEKSRAQKGKGKQHG
jgi:hypothetical protein